MKVDLDPQSIRNSIKLWRDAVELKLPMSPEARSQLILMRAKVLDRCSQGAISWSALLSACTAEGEDAVQLQRLKEEVEDFRVWAHENLKMLAELARE